MPISSKRLSEGDFEALGKILGAGPLRIIIEQPTFASGRPVLDPAQIPAPRERRTPVVPEESGLRQEDWFAPIQKSMKDARANLDLVAEEFVRLAAAGQVSYDTFDQQRKALEYLNGRDKENADLDAKMGKNAAAMRDAFTGVQKSMLLTTATLAGTYASLRQLAGEAQPGLWRAMGGAVSILSAEMGSALLPEMMSVADAVLNLSEWFASMDETTRKLIAGGALAIPATIAVGHAIAALGPVANAARIGIAALYASLGPLGATVAALGVAAGTAAMAVQAADYFSSQGKSNPSQQDNAGQPATEAELQTALNLTTKEGVHANAGEHAFDLEGHVLAHGESPEGLRERARATRARAQEIHDDPFRSNAVAAQMKDAADLFERAADHGFTSAETEAKDKKQEALTRQAKHYQAMVTEAQRVQEPRYSGLADARKQLQLNLLKVSPTEQMLRNIQRDNLKVMQARLHGILEQLEQMNRRDARQQ